MEGQSGTFGRTTSVGAYSDTPRAGQAPPLRCWCVNVLVALERISVIPKPAREESPGSHSGAPKLNVRLDDALSGWNSGRSFASAQDDNCGSLAYINDHDAPALLTPTPARPSDCRLRARHHQRAGSLMPLCRQPERVHGAGLRLDAYGVLRGVYLQVRHVGR